MASNQPSISRTSLELGYHNPPFSATYQAIHCYRPGDNPIKDVFKVKIQDLSGVGICDLKEILAEKLKTDVPSQYIRLHKVHVERKDIRQVMDFFPGEELEDTLSKLSEHWTPEKLLTGSIHLIVVLPSCASLLALLCLCGL